MGLRGPKRSPNSRRGQVELRKFGAVTDRAWSDVSGAPRATDPGCEVPKSATKVFADSYWVKRIARQYRISEADYDAMLAKQDGRCAICRRFGRLGIDHCHSTGLVRGLLCRRCNAGLGMLGDSTAELRAACAYLERAERGG